MANIVISGDSSGSVTLSAPAVSGTTVLTLPTTSGTLVVTGGAQTIEFADGTVSAPSITNSGDTNTGIFFPAADTIAFTEGGVESMRINASGSVGIGTASPNDKLDVNGADAFIRVDRSNGEPGITMRYNGSGTNRGDILVTSGGAMYFTAGGSTERMRIDSSGRVGIGTASPDTTTLLTVAGAVTITGANSGHGASRLKLGQDTSAISQIRFYGADNSTPGILQFTGSSADGNIGGERMRITSGGDVGIGTTSPSSKLGLSIDNATMRIGHVVSTDRNINIRANTGYNASMTFTEEAVSDRWSIGTKSGIDPFIFATGNSLAGGTERMRLTGDGFLLVGTTNTSTDSGAGVKFGASGYISGVRSSGQSGFFNRLTDDGQIVVFKQDGTDEGNISVSGNTVSYNSFAGSHWSQLADGSKPAILRGTVLESINELVKWPNEPTTERLCRVKISDTASSKKVYGVFMCWDEEWAATNDMLVTAVGAFVCRINKDVVVQEGDLLESNGDGTARVQADDVMRSSTIGKVTCTAKTHEYDDGSYCVPTVLYCG